jgi:urease accessory protein UreF
MTQADPRWIEAGHLFDAQLGQQPYWAMFPAARARIRYAVQVAAVGLSSTYGDADAILAHEVDTFVQMNEAGVGLLAQCRAIARAAARAAETGDST